jgi:hypothetical protein
MTEAARRQVARPARRPSPTAVVMWTGLVLGTFLAVEALTHDVMLPFFGGFADAVLTFVLILAACAVFAELTRRHHRTVARHAVRHGKRGASAAYRGTRTYGGRGAAFVAGRAKARWDGWRARPEAPAGADDPLPLSVEWGVPAAPASPSPAPQSPNSTGGTNRMTVSRIAPARRARRTAARTGGSMPAAWGPVIALAADFEPEDDAALLDWMNGQVTGMSGYGEALVDLYDHCTNVIGIDPAASALLHDVADAVAHAAEAMSAAKAKFTDHYELPREFAGNGGLMTHDGRWVTGEGA